MLRFTGKQVETEPEWVLAQIDQAFAPPSQASPKPDRFKVNDILRRDRWHANLDQQGYSDERLADISTVMNALTSCRTATWQPSLQLPELRLAVDSITAPTATVQHEDTSDGIFGWDPRHSELLRPYLQECGVSAK